MNELWKFLRTHWRLLGIILAAMIVICLLLLYRLSSLTGGASDGEVARIAFSGSWHHVADNPLFLPLTFVQWLFLAIFSHHQLAAIRLASVVFGLFSLVSFTYVLRRWYGVRTAVFGAVILATASWFLHVSRWGGTEVAYLWAVPMLIATQIAWERHSSRPIASFLAVIVLALLLYVPGMFWLILVSLGLQYRHVLESWQKLQTIQQRVALPLAFGIILIPLIIAFLRTPSLAETWLGLPERFSAPAQMLARLGHSFTFLFWHGPSDSQLWLSNLAILNLFTIAMTIGGVLFYGTHITAPRTRLLIGLFIVSIIFFALGGPVGYSIVMPLVYLLVAAGIGYLLHEWLRVFPRNPLARSIGFGLLSLVVALSCLYNLRSYFIAWPHNPATKTAFHNRP